MGAYDQCQAPSLFSSSVAVVAAVMVAASVVVAGVVTVAAALIVTNALFLLQHLGLTGFQDAQQG